MRSILISLIVIVAAGCATAAGTAERNATFAPAAGTATTSYEPMKVFEPIAGKSWRGEGTGPDGKPVVDIAKHEFILGGRAFQSTHRLEDGIYGGRTIFFYDEAAKDYVFHYFTTAGFHTTGKITPTDYGFDAVEKVQGHPTVVEVRSKLYYQGATLRTETSHVDKDGAMTEGEGFVYRLIEPVESLFGSAEAVEGE